MAGLFLDEVAPFASETPGKQGGEFGDRLAAALAGMLLGESAHMAKRRSCIEIYRCGIDASAVVPRLC